MKKILLVLSLLILTQYGQSQFVCGTNYFLEQKIKNNPALGAEMERLWNLGAKSIIARSPNWIQAVKVIPIVFHIFHDGNNGNISNAQIRSALDILNEDFRRVNGDANQTRAIFKPYAVDIGIEFKMAQIDPRGNFTNGIVRIENRNAANHAGDFIKGLSYWPADRYLNIWVANNIDFSSPGTLLGYAQFPGSGRLNEFGVVIRNDALGNIGTSFYSERTLTHEVGHCFNLLHTFQSGCGSSCNTTGDRVCDTPPVRYSTQGCDTNQNLCSNDAVGSSPFTSNIVDQIENYMSYDACQNMFSQGQKNRMLNAFDNYSFLESLGSQGNLIQSVVILKINSKSIKPYFNEKKYYIKGFGPSYTSDQRATWRYPIMPNTQDENGAEEADLDLRIYPNPSTSVLHIDILGKTQEGAQLIMFDDRGKWVKSIQIGKTSNEKSQFTIQRGALKPGIYFIKIKSGKDEITRKVFFE